MCLGNALVAVSCANGPKPDALYVTTLPGCASGSTSSRRPFPPFRITHAVAHLVGVNGTIPIANIGETQPDGRSAELAVANSRQIRRVFHECLSEAGAHAANGPEDQESVRL